MIRKVVLTAIFIYVSMGVWFNATYNWPPPVEPVTFKTYKLNCSEIPEEELIVWEQAARSVEGVTALTLNRESEILAVSVKENHLLDHFIENNTSWHDNLQIEPLSIASDGSEGCPYHRTLDRIAFLFRWPYISQTY